MLERKSIVMEKYFVIYVSDLMQVCPDFFVDEIDQEETAQLYFSWKESCKYPAVKIHRHDVDGGDYLPYDIDPVEFFTSIYPALVEANCFEQEGECETRD